MDIHFYKVVTAINKMKRQRDVAKKLSEDVQHIIQARLIHKARADAFDQAIAIVEEVMKNDE